MIGIRLADHSVFPVYGDEAPGGRRLVVTTARDDQDRVDIEMVHSAESGDGLEDTVSLGRVRLDHLTRHRRGEPEIEVVFRLDADHRLTVRAVDRENGNEEQLSIDMNRQRVDAAYNTPPSLTENLYANADDIALPSIEDKAWDDRSGQGDSTEPETWIDEHDEETQPPRRRAFALLLPIVIVLILAAVAFFVWRAVAGTGMTPDTPSATTADAETPEPTPSDSASGAPSDAAPGAASGAASDAAPGAASGMPSDAASPPSQQSQETEADASMVTGDEPSAGAVRVEPSEVEPAVQAGDDGTNLTPIEYRIRRGDTLWDISEAFYGTPWLFPELAEENRIPNPDLIFAEDDLLIPQQPRQ